MNRWEGILNFMYCRLQRLFKYNLSIFFFFNDTATTEIYTLSLHDALPISFHQFTGEITLVANVFLAFPALHAIERRLGGENVLAGDQLLHVAGEKSKQQRPAGGPLHAPVGPREDFLVAQPAAVQKGPAHAR